MYYSVCLLVCKFVCLQHISKATVWMVTKSLGSIRIFTRQNCFKFGHDRISILDSGAMFYLHYKISVVSVKGLRLKYISALYLYLIWCQYFDLSCQFSSDVVRWTDLVTEVHFRGPVGSCRFAP